MTSKEYRKGYYRMIKGLFGALAARRWDYDLEDYQQLIAALQEIVSDNRWRLSISEKDELRVTYCDTNSKYTKRLITTFGRFVSRRLRTEVSNDAVNYLWDTYKGGYGATNEIVEGKNIYYAYEDGYGANSCMTGEDAYKVTLYVENPEKIKLLKYSDKLGHKARALIWRTDQGVVVLDRIYASSKHIIPIVEEWAKTNGLVPRGELSIEKPLTVTVKRPSDKRMPYIDTFCELMEVTEDSYVLTFWADHPLHIFHDTNGADYATRVCCVCGNPIDEDSGDYYYENDEFYCDQCFNEIYFWCEDCENYVRMDDAVSVYDACRNERLACSYCAERYYEPCRDCGALHPEGYLECVIVGRNETVQVCDNCIDYYDCCEGCGYHFAKELMQGDYCKDCYQDYEDSEDIAA